MLCWVSISEVFWKSCNQHTDKSTFWTADVEPLQGKEKQKNCDYIKQKLDKGWKIRLYTLFNVAQPTARDSVLGFLSCCLSVCL